MKHLAARALVLAALLFCSLASAQQASWRASIDRAQHGACADSLAANDASFFAAANIAVNPAFKDVDLAKYAIANIKVHLGKDVPADLIRQVIGSNHRQAFNDLHEMSPEIVAKKIPREALIKIVTLPFELQYYELPLDVIGPFVQAERLTYPENPALQDMVVSERNGRRFLRWFVNPLAGNRAPIHALVDSFFRDKQLYFPLRRGGYTGRFTASRSIIVQDDRTGAVASLKLSVPAPTSDAFLTSDKNISISMLRYWNFWDRFFAGPEGRRLPTDKVIVLREPLSAGLSFNQREDGFLLRDLGPMANGQLVIPAYAWLHETFGKTLAEVNGYATNPAALWSQALMPDMGEAFAWLRSLSVEHVSPHAQNIGFAVDPQGKRRGPVVLWDLDYAAEPEAFGSFLPAAPNSEKDKLIHKAMSHWHGFGILAGQTLPPWMPENEVRALTRSYFLKFSEQLRRLWGFHEMPPQWPALLWQNTSVLMALSRFVPVDLDSPLPDGQRNGFTIDLNRTGIKEGHEERLRAAKLAQAQTNELWTKPLLERGIPREAINLDSNQEPEGFAIAEMLRRWAPDFELSRHSSAFHKLIKLLRHLRASGLHMPQLMDRGLIWIKEQGDTPGHWLILRGQPVTPSTGDLFTPRNEIERKILEITAKNHEGF